MPGGLLTGFLAEEEDPDRRSLWRLGSCTCPLAAVIVAVLAQSVLDRMAARADRQCRSGATVAAYPVDRQGKPERDMPPGFRDRYPERRPRPAVLRITVLEQGLDLFDRLDRTANCCRGFAASHSLLLLGNVFPADSSSMPPSSPAASSPSPPSPATSASAASSPTARLRRRHLPRRLTCGLGAGRNGGSGSGKGCGHADNRPPPASEPAAVGIHCADGVKRAPADAGNAADGPAKSIMAPPDAAAGKLVRPRPSAEAAVVAPDPQAGRRDVIGRRRGGCRTGGVHGEANRICR